MTATKLKNLRAMKAIAEKKDKYGISQVTIDFSPSSKLISDSKAVYGKKVLREKIYGKIE